VLAYDKPVIEPGIECLNCGNTEPKLTYRVGDERIQKCGKCGNFVTTKSGLLKLFRHFAGVIGEFPANYYWTPLITGEKYSTLYEGNQLSEEKKIAFFNLHSLSVAIEKMDAETITKMERRWWFLMSGAAEKHPELEWIIGDQTQTDLIPMTDPGEKYSAYREGFTKVFSIQIKQNSETREKRIEEKAGHKVYLDGFQVYTCTTTELTEIGHIARKDLFQGNDQGLRVAASQGFLDSSPKRTGQDLWMLKYPLTVGTRWTKPEELRFLKEKVTVPLTCEIDAVDEVVSIPCGTFENCIRVKEFFDGKIDCGSPWGEPEVRMESFSSYAPDLGRIKTTYKVDCSSSELGGGESLMEMISYES
jgi:hypothetical protein